MMVSSLLNSQAGRSQLSKQEDVVGCTRHLTNNTLAEGVNGIRNILVNACRAPALPETC